jgi:uncharacterized protein YegJ (DUF2314 family)
LGTISIILASCTDTPMKVIERGNEPGIYQVQDDDVGMNNAISSAISALNQFDSAYINNHFDTSTFALKVKLSTTTGFEHIWATSISMDKGDYYGEIDNLPSMLTKVKLGDKLKISKADISDWMYSDNGRLIGGFTIKEIRSRMTGQEKQEFDKSFQLKIED